MTQKIGIEQFLAWLPTQIRRVQCYCTISRTMSARCNGIAPYWFPVKS